MPRNTSKKSQSMWQFVALQQLSENSNINSNSNFKSQVTFNARKYTSGASINIHLVSGVLNGLICSNRERSGKYMDFEVKRSWARSLYQSIKFSHRGDTTLRPVITRPLWAEVRSQFLHDITNKVLQHNIPDELIINVDQTTSKFIATDNITMAANWEKHILCAGTTGCILRFQLI